MALVSGTSAASGTLTGSTVDTVILTKPCSTVTVVNVTGSAAIYFTVCTVGGPSAQPTVGGADCKVLPAAIGSVDVKIISGYGVVVNLISSGTPGYTVEII